MPSMLLQKLLLEHVSDPSMQQLTGVMMTRLAPPDSASGACSTQEMRSGQVLTYGCPLPGVDGAARVSNCAGNLFQEQALLGVHQHGLIPSQPEGLSIKGVGAVQVCRKPRCHCCSPLL